MATATVNCNRQPQAVAITMTTGGTEYSIEITDANCIRFKDRANAAVVRYAFIAGIVGTGTASGVMTLPAGTTYQSPVDPNGGRRSFTLYVASATAGMVLEAEVW